MKKFRFSNENYPREAKRRMKIRWISCMWRSSLWKNRRKYNQVVPARNLEFRSVSRLIPLRKLKSISDFLCLCNHLILFIKKNKSSAQNWIFEIDGFFCFFNILEGNWIIDIVDGYFVLWNILCYLEFIKSIK